MLTAAGVHDYITSHTEAPMMQSVECVSQMCETNTDVAAKAGSIVMAAYRPTRVHLSCNVA